MPQLKWDPTDFIECLEVVPINDSYDAELTYRVERNELVLTLTMWQHESVLKLNLAFASTGNTITEFCLVLPMPVEFVKEKDREFLLFKRSVVSPSRFYYHDIEGNPFDQLELKARVDVKLSVNPTIKIEYLRP